MAVTALHAPVCEEIPGAVTSALEAYGEADAAADVRAAMAAQDAVHGWEQTAHILHVDPVPRVCPAGEGAALEAGLAQRVAALEAFLHDAAGPRHGFAGGVVPADLLDGSEWVEPEAL